VFSRDLLGRRVIAQNIADIASNPYLYEGDITVFMALGSSARRLIYDASDEAADTVQDMLWDIALKLEDGGLTVAARELSDTLQKLSQALNNKDMNNADVKQLLAEVQKKMREYMQTLARELAQRLDDGKHTSVMPPQLAEKFMNHIDLDELMQQLQQMSQDNPREALKRMAEMLKNAVDNIDMDKFGEMQKKQMQAMESLEDLQNLIREQQTLADKTSRLAPGESTTEQTQQQKELREKLDGVTKKLAGGLRKLPENFGKAGQAMQSAESALANGDAKSAAAHQKTALDELQKGMDGSIEEMAKSMQQSVISFGMPSEGGGFGEGFDPLGRKDNGKNSGDLKIPEGAERRRVQDIIRELRGRSNDYQRPKVEREYLDRLLDQLN
jgi:Domain of unknown function (DUF4175)